VPAIFLPLRCSCDNTSITRSPTPAQRDVQCSSLLLLITTPVYGMVPKKRKRKGSRAREKKEEGKEEEEDKKKLIVHSRPAYNLLQDVVCSEQLGVSME